MFLSLMAEYENKDFAHIDAYLYIRKTFVKNSSQIRTIQLQWTAAYFRIMWFMINDNFPLVYSRDDSPDILSPAAHTTLGNIHCHFCGLWRNGAHQPPWLVGGHPLPSGLFSIGKNLSTIIISFFTTGRGGSRTQK